MQQIEWVQFLTAKTRRARREDAMNRTKEEIDLEPLEITPEEEADLAEWRQRVKEYTIANMHKGIEGLSE